MDNQLEVRNLNAFLYNIDDNDTVESIISRILYYLSKKRKKLRENVGENVVMPMAIIKSSAINVLQVVISRLKERIKKEIKDKNISKKLILELEMIENIINLFMEKFINQPQVIIREIIDLYEQIKYKMKNIQDIFYKI